ncbi:MAG: glycoside hydrolase family 15 protein [Thermodesulfobacteriota bacterium]
MGYKKIADYGIIGNGQTLALVGVDGSIDWLCLPYMDSPSVFAAILDDERGGRFQVLPLESWDSSQRYQGRTNILATRFRTAAAECELLDFMPLGPLAEQVPGAGAMVCRCLRGLAGRVSLGIEFSPRFQYGLAAPASWQRVAPGVWRRESGSETINLYISAAMEREGDHLTLELGEGETVWLAAVYGELQDVPSPEFLARLLAETEEYWQAWLGAQETGKYPHLGFWQDDLDRAALVLKLLQFRQTGAIAAAASCSLPTIIYGQRNWDYRFSWVRDTSMTLQALFELGHTREVSLYMEWLKKLGRQGESADLEVLYQLREPLPPAGEKELTHLSGYKGSSPVLTGQFNIGQHQHDIYGELLEMIFAMSRLVGKIDPDYWSFVRRLVDKVVVIWRERDNGIWELRTGPHHVSHSKVMCWVALDRGIKIADHYGFPADLAKWRQERDAVHADVLAKAFDPKRGFTQHYETKEMDAALLQIPLVGFLPADDPRMVRTIRTIEQELMVGGIPLRYRADDGLPGQEHGWLICLFWYLRCLIRQKRFAEVEAHLRKVSGYANHLGLLGEEYDTVYQEITGNFPQAFSHLGYAMTVLEFVEARQARKLFKPPSLLAKLHLLLRGRNLTPAIPEAETALVANPGKEIKGIMNILRGQFYDGQRQRIDYQLISSSEHYRKFAKAVAALRHFDPASLERDGARIAFWANVFNTLVIHGVIALGINESVKEYPLFFERVRYRIGSHEYSLSDIEHGILRGNSVPPYRLARRFAAGDPRRAFCVAKPDPRVHFALVCASRTCPPIEAYDEELLDGQLETSARVFINATTKVDKENKKLSVSKIFRWYEKDFALVTSDLPSLVAGYLYDGETGHWLRANGAEIAVCYTPYDWRLNR